MGKKGIDVAKKGAKEPVGHVVAPKAQLNGKTGGLAKVNGFASKLLGKAASTVSTVKTTVMEKAKMLMASKKEQAMHKISSKSAKDDSNLSTSYGSTGVNKSAEDILKMRAGDTIVEVRTEKQGKVTFDRVYVKSDAGFK